MWQIATPPTPPSFPDPVVISQFPTPPPWVTLPPEVVVLITLAFFVVSGVVLFPLMRAIGRRIEGRGNVDPALRAEVEQLRSRLADVETLQHRVMELEERLDFAERLLSQRREPERLGRGDA